MKQDFHQRLRAAGHLASNTWTRIKKNWVKDSRVLHLKQSHETGFAYKPLTPSAHDAYMPAVPAVKQSLGAKLAIASKHIQKFWLALEDIFPGLSRVRRFCWGALKKYYHDDCFSYAAGLSFWLLISLVPLATLFFKMLVFLLGRQAFYQQTIETLSKVIPFVPVSFLNEALTHSREISNTLGFTWLVLLFGGYWGVNQLDTTLAHVFGVRINKKLQTRKNIILRQIILLVGGLTVLALVLALLVGGAVSKYLPVRQGVILYGLPTIICLVATTLVFQFMTRIHVTFRRAFLGALVTTIFWTIARWGFKIYVDNALTWGIMYGSLIGIIAGLTFLYYTCAILLLGAEVTAAFYRKKKSHSKS